jgi:hypothetical protein
MAALFIQESADRFQLTTLPLVSQACSAPQSALVCRPCWSQVQARPSTVQRECSEPEYINDIYYSTQRYDTDCTALTNSPPVSQFSSALRFESISQTYSSRVPFLP